MVAINQKNHLTSGDINSPDINLDSNLRRWFSRNIGHWKSNRTYYLEDIRKTYNLSMNLKIESLQNENPWQSHYRFSWFPDKEYSFFKENPQFQKNGVMQAYLQGHQLIREKFYLTDSKGISNVKQIDEHEMIFESSYEDWFVIEHTRLVVMDNFRYRVIYSWEKNILKIVENHHEIRLDN